MDIRVLKTFMTVAKLSSFSQAAEQLNFTQPAVTAQIHTLEKELGVRLFNRVGKKIFLSDAGKCLAKYAETILNLWEEAKLKIEPFGNIQPALSLGLSTQIVNYILPPILHRLQETLPGTLVSVEVCPNTKTVLEGLAEDRYDLGFIHGRNLLPKLIAHHRVWHEEIVWVASSKLTGSRFLHRCPYPLVNFSKGSDLRNQFDKTISSRLFHTRLEYSDSEAVKKAVLNGLGISYLPRTLVRKEIEEGQLTVLDGLPKMKMQIFVAYRRSKPFILPAYTLLMLLIGDPDTEPDIKDIIEK